MIRTLGRMRGRAKLVSACAALCCALGCAGDASTDEQAEEAASAPQHAESSEALAELRDAVQELGFDPETLLVRGNQVVVEDDIILHRDKLLAGDYGSSYDKGWRNTLITQARVADIQIDDTGLMNMGRRLPLYWRGQIDQVLAQWNNVAGSRINMSRASTSSSRITIHVVAPEDAPTDICPTLSSPGCSEFPAGGLPGAHVWIKAPNPMCGEGRWTADFFKRVLIHEIGHALGFTHPGAGTHIAGTGRSGYDSVMSVSGCTPPWWTLRGDDVRSAELLYPN